MRAGDRNEVCSSMCLYCDFRKLPKPSIPVSAHTRDISVKTMHAMLLAQKEQLIEWCLNNRGMTFDPYKYLDLMNSKYNVAACLVPSLIFKLIFESSDPHDSLLLRCYLQDWDIYINGRRFGP